MIVPVVADDRVVAGAANDVFNTRQGIAADIDAAGRTVGEVNENTVDGTMIDKGIIALAADIHVIALATAADDDVVARTAFDDVVARIAGKKIIAVTTHDDVVAAAGDDGIAADPADDVLIDIQPAAVITTVDGQDDVIGCCRLRWTTDRYVCGLMTAGLRSSWTDSRPRTAANRRNDDVASDDAGVRHRIAANDRDRFAAGLILVGVVSSRNDLIAGRCLEGLQTAGIELGHIIAAATKAEIVAVVPLGRQMFQRCRKAMCDIAVVHKSHGGWTDIESGNHRELVGGVHDGDAAVIQHDNLADEAIRFRHQDDMHLAIGADLDADLSTANTDGGNRRIDMHGVGIGLGDPSAEKRENAFDHRQRQGAFVGGRIVDHLVEDHTAVRTHREGRVVGQHDADARIGRSLENVALEHWIADPQFDPRSIGTNGNHRTAHVVHGSDRFSRCRKAELRHLSGRQRTGQVAGQFSRHPAAIRGDQFGGILLREVASHHHLFAIWPGDRQVIADPVEARRRQRRPSGSWMAPSPASTTCPGAACPASSWRTAV